MSTQTKYARPSLTARVILTRAAKHMRVGAGDSGGRYDRHRLLPSTTPPILAMTEVTKDKVTVETACKADDERREKGGPRNVLIVFGSDLFLRFFLLALTLL